MKKYKIDNSEFQLIKYGDLQIADESKINELLGITASEHTLTISLSPSEILPLLLKPINERATNNTDWNRITSNQIIEIIIDFLMEKESFFVNLPDTFQNLLKQKMNSIGQPNPQAEISSSSPQTGKTEPTPSISH